MRRRLRSGHKAARGCDKSAVAVHLLIAHDDLPADSSAETGNGWVEAAQCAQYRQDDDGLSRWLGQPFSTFSPDLAGIGGGSSPARFNAPSLKGEGSI